MYIKYVRVRCIILSFFYIFNIFHKKLEQGKLGNGALDEGMSVEKKTITPNVF
jgi:hypothetical protein